MQATKTKELDFIKDYLSHFILLLHLAVLTNISKTFVLLKLPTAAYIQNKSFCHCQIKRQKDVQHKARNTFSLMKVDLLCSTILKC